MACAVYGVLLVFNSMTGLLVEGYFPFLLAVPLMVYVLSEKRPYWGTACFSMVILTFLLSGMTTWLNALTFLFGGCAAASAMGAESRRLALQQNREQSGSEKPEAGSGRTIFSFLFCWLIQFLCSFLSLTVLAGLFGYSMEEDQALFALFSSILSPYALLAIVSAITGLLQSVLLFLCSCIILKMERKPMPLFSFRSIFEWKYTGVLFILLSFAAVYLLNAPVLEWNVICRDAAVVSWLICLIVLDIRGLLLILSIPKVRKNPLLRLAAVLSAMIPPFLLIDAGAGLMADLRQLTMRTEK